MPSRKIDPPRSGDLLLTCLTLTIFWASVKADFYNEPFDSLSSIIHPWIRIDREISQDFASSDLSPSYSHYSESKKEVTTFDSAESAEKPKEWFTAAASKKVPTEEKYVKKVISPFYTITDKDSDKFKDMVMKSGVPFCQEIKKKRPNKDSMVCYKCKNPKNGATYEQCSYVAQPLTEDTNIEEIAIPPSGFRNRRSNSDESRSSFGSSDGFRSSDSPYRFNEKIFSDATDDVPTEYTKKNEKCEKVTRDSMVCMVCKDTKSNAKYEQCSYVRQPSEKRYAYKKSSSFNNPGRQSEKSDEEDSRRGSDRDYSESKPVREYSSHSDDKRDSDRESGEQSKESSNNCKKVEKDGQTCTVCKDPKTGGNSEKCSYTYQPDDKMYKYSRSNSYGYPQSSSSSSKDDSKEDASSDGNKSSGKSTADSDGIPDYIKDYSIPDSFYEKSSSSPSSSYFKDEPRSSYRQAASENSKSVSRDDDDLSGYERTRSESEKVAKGMEESNCKEVQKDSMTCKVCRDPKTGSNSEQCSYKYQPSDKSYAYSKSKTFGSPSESRDKSQEGSERKEYREPSYESKGYGFSADSEKPYVTDSDNKRESSTTSETKPEAKEDSAQSAPIKPDSDFYEAFKKKAEIQKFLQEFQKEDRSNCKKVMRDKMTCYLCTDDKGMKKEECAFVTAEEPTGDKSENREVKEYQVEPTKKVPRSIIVDDALLGFPIEPEAAASDKVYVKRENPAEKGSEEAGTSKNAETSKEAEPYEYVAETRPVFDKTLGFTLPAYMLSTSEHEEEFDKIVSNSRI